LGEVKERIFFDLGSESDNVLDLDSTDYSLCGGIHRKFLSFGGRFARREEGVCASLGYKVVVTIILDALYFRKRFEIAVHI